MDAKLVLEDGTVFEGDSFGASVEKAGEVVFNTSMTGYQEILTDPSYRGQIVTMTCPLIGNYGINPEDEEAVMPQVEGFVVREASDIVSNFRSRESLQDYLKRHNIPAIEGVDTRFLTKRLREKGAMRGVISTVDMDNDSLRKKALSSPLMEGRDLVSGLGQTERVRKWTQGAVSEFTPKVNPGRKKFNIVAIDYGIKFAILRYLVESGCNVIVAGADAPAEEILSHKPDGIFLSNGPGDPAVLTGAVKTVKTLAYKLPVFGICLGHQIMSLAFGAKTYKLKFGHRGANHPVKDLITDKIEITCQNHGFAVDPDTLAKTELEITHVNLNDRTVEGVRHKKLPVFSVQFHPEASPGPHDSLHLFERFTGLMEKEK